jgi:hypothetical protein
VSALSFSHDGSEYRIGFQHERPRDWNAHYKHTIVFQPVLDDQDEPTGSYRIYCQKCRCAISGIGPDASRALRSIGRQADAELAQLANGMGANVALALQKRAKAARRMMARDLARDVTCTIYVRGGEPIWAPVYIGHSRLNTDAGDVYNREDGRMAALRDALPKPIEPTQLERDRMMMPPVERTRKAFVAAAIECYLCRARKTSKAGGK